MPLGGAFIGSSFPIQDDQVFVRTWRVLRVSPASLIRAEPLAHFDRGTVSLGATQNAVPSGHLQTWIALAKLAANREEALIPQPVNVVALHSGPAWPIWRAHAPHRGLAPSRLDGAIEYLGRTNFHVKI